MPAITSCVRCGAWILVEHLITWPAGQSLLCARCFDRLWEED